MDAGIDNPPHMESAVHDLWLRDTILEQSTSSDAPGQDKVLSCPA